MDGRDYGAHNATKSDEAGRSEREIHENSMFRFIARTYNTSSLLTNRLAIVLIFLYTVQIKLQSVFKFK